MATISSAAADPGLLHGRITNVILGAFYRVYDKLGFGFLESVYKNALARELTKAGLAFEREVPVKVWYDGECIGHFRADFVVEGLVIVEVKASQVVVEADHKQLLNYLRCSDIELGLLLHYGPRASFQRRVYTNERKSRGSDKHEQTQTTTTTA